MSIRITSLVTAAAVLLSASLVRAQTPSAVPSFEIVSIKRSNPNPPPNAAYPIGTPGPGGRYTAQNMPLRLLIRFAYDVQDFQIVGGPAWQLSDKFDIQARAANPNATMADMRQLLKGLLAERFGLKTHTETRELPTFTLVVARADRTLGPNITPSTVDCAAAAREQARTAQTPGQAAATPCGIGQWPGAPGGYGMRYTGQPIASLTNLLTQVTGRMVQDKTGLQGRFDYQLSFDPRALVPLGTQAGVAASVPQSELPGSENLPLLTAVQDQLGLRLESQRGPVQVLVIDGAGQPSEN